LNHGVEQFIVHCAPIAFQQPKRYRAMAGAVSFGHRRGHRRSIRRHVGQLHHARLEQQRDEPAPAGLMRSADAASVVAVKVLMEQDEILRTRVGCSIG